MYFREPDMRFSLVSLAFDNYVRKTPNKFYYDVSNIEQTESTMANINH